MAHPIVHESLPIKLAKIVRNLGIGFFAAIITGITSGLYHRLLMKIIALVFLYGNNL